MSGCSLSDRALRHTLPEQDPPTVLVDHSTWNKFCFYIAKMALGVNVFQGLGILSADLTFDRPNVFITVFELHWRIICCNEEFYNLNYSPNIIRTIKLRKLPCSRHVARMRKLQIMKLWFFKFDRKTTRGDPRRPWEENMKMDHLSGSGWEIVASTRGPYIKEISSSIKTDNFSKSNDYQFLKKSLNEFK